MTSGCVGSGVGSAITFGSCTTEAQTYMSNGTANTNGTTDMPPSLSDNQKYDNPTVASLSWISAADIGLLFNATEPGGDSINVADVTPSFFDAITGCLLGAIDGNYNFASTVPGTGSAGFVFTVAPDQRIM